VCFLWSLERFNRYACTGKSSFTVSVRAIAFQTGLLLEPTTDPAFLHSAVSLPTYAGQTVSVDTSITDQPPVRRDALQPEGCDTWRVAVRFAIH
jgi:hypothetical protein